MKGLRFLKRLTAALRREDYALSYSQCGEDRVLRFFFDLIQIPHPTYLDIGAHHPTYLSNTYAFYAHGSRGVCVEPNPILHQRIQARRPGDTCLNIGIALGDVSELAFYVFENPTMSTFSEESKEQQILKGSILTETLQIKVESVNDVMAQYFKPYPNLVSLDTEGFDFLILQTFDFDRYRPEAFCIETLTNAEERKMTEIIDFMIGKDYFVYADTYLNTIFVDKLRWAKRFGR